MKTFKIATVLMAISSLALLTACSNKVPISSVRSSQDYQDSGSEEATSSETTTEKKTVTADDSMQDQGSEDASVSPYADDSAKNSAENDTPPAGCEGGYYKVGKPYTVEGQTYTPAEDYTLVQTGTISFYGAGDGFAGKKTANNETYDPMALTAAHRTLPLPSMVRVTNLDEGLAKGRSVIVRVNDRGPFKKDRIMDVSRKTAQLLGFEGKGTARVKIEVLQDESMKAKEEAMNCRVPSASSTGALSDSEAAAQPGGGQMQGDYFVQVAAFPAYDTADQLKQKVADIYNTVIGEADVNGRTMYRVRLGPVTDKAAAEDILQKAKSRGYNDARIVKDVAGNVKWVN